jgi:hypothetical protein
VGRLEKRKHVRRDVDELAVAMLGWRLRRVYAPAKKCLMVSSRLMTPSDSNSET